MNSTTFKRPLAGCLTLGAALLLPHLPTQAQVGVEASIVIPPVTVKEIMVGAIEPASNALWAIALEENAPTTEDGWTAVEHEAIRLLAASSAISLGGSGEQDRAWAADPRWQQYSRDMAGITLNILEALRARNYDAALDAGNALIEPCGACHSDFPGSSQ
ncbi:hypothetical protein ACXYTJ_14355 [Gilvimarinus sp. F26214L]|uniref:hypothetical protein n=1 Tax=Gilvimarinus sp. DZF01 TaxID=3461371 RepID=UPI004045E3BE